ncbi:hypothetical protein PIB30_037861 [Stylosanthes scabra]|uniref:Uncharacterized protein n=1 Tax=Stylosanthes scabra TaxID=79078 RepID=A0ABU6WDY4_9FABA|nr:hypothetical protein [Stylosanthes scabra]
MTIPEKNPYKLVPFTEQDAARLLQRYDATTVITLLQEVAQSQYPNAKIDWNDLVKRTSTGISNAREYQMLWRHLAYRHDLVSNLENGAEPLDDDSDLEYEVEALPGISAEVASETVACVKVMIDSHSLSESTPSSSTIEAPLTIHAPVCNSSRTSNKSSQSTSLMQGTEIIFPVTIKRQTLPNVSSTDNIESKGLDGSNMASKKRRMTWSEEEDNLLRDAVQRFGEGHWATIAKGENFHVKRTAAQISHRWNFLRKKDDSTNSGSILTSTRYNTAEQLATRHSLSLALDMPLKKLTAPGVNSRRPLNMSGKRSLQHVAIESSTLHGNVVPPQHPSQQSLVGSCGSSLKSTLVSEKPLSEVTPTLNPMVKGTTVVSGAQIVSTSDSASRVKVSHGNVVATTSSLTKSSTPASLPPESKIQFRTGPSSAPVHTKKTIVIACPASGIKPPKASSLKMEKSPAALSASPEQEKHDNSLVYEAPTKQEVQVANPNRTAMNRMVQIDRKLDHERSMHGPPKKGKEITSSKEVTEGNKSGNC